MMFIKILLIKCLTLSVLCDTNYRLNTNVIPSEYEITITPYFETGDKRAFTFNGQVTIKVSTRVSGIKQIKLHSEGLIFNSHNVTVRNKNGIVPLSIKNPIEYNDTYTFTYINLETPLLVNVEYTVNIVYTGSIRDDLIGLYRISYLEKGQTKWAVTTQLAGTHARKMFPCFDEPQLKAKFTLVVDRPKNYSPTLSNTKIQSTTNLNNGYIRERFFPTPIMSTYLVAITISQYSNGGYIDKGNREFGIWARPEAASQAKYAYDFGKKILAALTDFVGIDYYSIDSNLNLYHVGHPVFSSGGMENWGMINYKEEFLMYVPSETIPFYKYYLVQGMTHETILMWFGDLVTSHWWSDAWLNEGFAVYFRDYLPSLIEPELGSADAQVTFSIYGAYTADEEKNPDTLSRSVNSPDEIDKHYNAITYDKSGAIFRMIHHWIGDDAFKNGLRLYLNAGRLSVGTPTMLYSALDKAVNSTKALAAYPSYTVAKLMSVWANQPGHPILNVQLNTATGQITLTQSRFYADKALQSNELYPIPITYTTQSAANFDNTKPAFIMSEKTRTFGNFSNAGWVIFNIQETGFYRVNYDEHLWTLIRNALKGPNRNQIHHLNRAKIINDYFALKVAEKIDYNQLFDMLEVLTDELDFSVWVPALAGMYGMKYIMLTTPGSKLLHAFILGLMDKLIQNLGFDERPTDSFVTLRNRMQMSWMACDSNHEGCSKHAVSVFRAFRDKGVPIAPSIRQVVYCEGLKYGTAEDYDFMYKRKITTNVMADYAEIEGTLSCTRDKNKQMSYLQQIIAKDTLIRSDLLTSPLDKILGDPDKFQVAFGFLKQNYAALKEKIPNVLLHFPYSAIRPSDLADFEAWLMTCTVCAKEDIKSAKETIQAAKKYRSQQAEQQKQIIAALKNRNLARTK